MKIVDSHAHIMLSEYASLKPVEPEVLVERFAEYGVDQVWYSCADALIENQTDLHQRSNDQMAELQRKFGKRFVALATVNPRHGEQAARELKRAIMDLGLRGLKIHGWLQPVSCCDPCLEPLFEVANHLKLIVVFHDGTPPFTSSLQIGWLAEKYPDCSMILGHGGLKDLAVNAHQAIRRYPNMYMQTPATTFLALQKAIELVGPEKILYGSDGGFGNPKWIDYNIRKIRKLPLSSEDQAKILRENARGLLNRSK
ncbi:MAG: amidohydrolase family protein [Planctomycetota bacterium]|jgi:predicted TIM-barrel fold metal-dependent hydrolase